MLPRRFDRGSGFEGQRNDSESFYRNARNTEYYDYQRRRSPSPRRDDRRIFPEKESSWDVRPKGRNAPNTDWQDERGRNRNTRTPPTQRAGLLGAGPGDVPPANISGQPGVNQQVIAALQAQQTQAWLAALQANQLQMNNSGGPGNNGPPGGGYSNNRPSQGRPSGPRPRPWANNSRKRLVDEPSGPMQKRKRDDARPAGRPYAKGDTPHRRYPSKPGQHGKESDSKSSNDYNPAEPTTDNDHGKSPNASILAELCAKVEELRQREKIERNICDQDVDKLVLFSFNGQVYKCDVCKVMCRSAYSLRQHLMAKKHSMAVIQERGDGKDPCREIMDIDLKPNDWFAKNEVAKVMLEKQAAALETVRQEQRKKEFEENPANYISYSINRRKFAVKKEQSVFITDASEITVKIKDFTNDQQMFGSEFVKAVIGFNCELCQTLINRDTSVVNHIRSRCHKANYKAYIQEHEDYEAKQAANNGKLESVLSEHENKHVLLQEAFESNDNYYIKREDADLVKPSMSLPSWTDIGTITATKPEVKDEEKGTEDEVKETEAAAGEEENEIAEGDTDAATAPTEEDEEIDAAAMIDADEDDVPPSQPSEEEEAASTGADEPTDEAEVAANQNEEPPSPAAVAVKAEEETPEVAVKAEEDKPATEEPTKETTPSGRLPTRRAARGGAQARRGKGRGTPKGKTYKVKAVVVKPETMLDEGDSFDGYEVIDEVQL